MRREFEEKARALKEIEALAAKNGYTLDELMGLPRGKAGQTKKPVAIRFRSPEGQTWTGRGRTPTWLSEAIGKGASKDDFAV